MSNGTLSVSRRAAFPPSLLAALDSSKPLHAAIRGLVSGSDKSVAFRSIGCLPTHSRFTTAPSFDVVGSDRELCSAVAHAIPPCWLPVVADPRTDHVSFVHRLCTVTRVWTPDFPDHFFEVVGAGDSAASYRNAHASVTRSAGLDCYSRGLSGYSPGALLREANKIPVHVDDEPFPRPARRVAEPGFKPRADAGSLHSLRMRERAGTRRGYRPAPAAVARAARAELSALRKRLRGAPSPAFPQSGGFFAGVLATVAAAGTFVAARAAARSAARMARKGSDTLSAVTRAADAVSSAFSVCTDVVKKFAIPAAIAALLYYLHTRSRKKSANGARIGVAVDHSLIQLLLPDIPKDLAKEVTPQSGLFTSSSMAKVVVGVTLWKMVGSLGSRPWMASQITRSIETNDRKIKGWESFISMTVGFLESTVNWMRSWFGKDPVTFQRKLYMDVCEWNSQVLALDLDVKAGRAGITVATGRRASGLHSMEADLRKKYELNADVTRLMSHFSKLLNVHLESLAAVISGARGQRAQPPVVMLRGLPGIGKTLVSSFVMKSVIAATLPEEEKKRLNYKYDGLIYQFLPRTNFVDAWNNAPVTYMDDVGAERLTPGEKESSYGLIMSLANPYPKPLQQASLANKGNAYFTSDWIFATTNVNNMRLAIEPVLADADAFLRRLSLPYEMILNEAHAVDTPQGKMLDVEEFKELQRREKELAVAEGRPARYPNLWTFRPYDYSTGTAVSGAPCISIDEFIAVIIKAVRSSQTNFSQFEEFNDYIFKGEACELPSRAAPFTVHGRLQNVIPQANWRRPPRPDPAPAMLPIEEEPGEVPLPPVPGRLNQLLLGRWHQDFQRSVAGRLTAVMLIFFGLTAGWVAYYCLAGLLRQALQAVLALFKSIGTAPRKFWFRGKSKRNAEPGSNTEVGRRIAPQKGFTVLGTTDTVSATLNAVTANTVAVHIVGVETVHVGYATFICDRMLCMPRHFICSFDRQPHDEVMFVRVLDGSSFRMPTTYFSADKDALGKTTRITDDRNDVAFFRLPGGQAYKDISRKFATASQMEKRRSPDLGVQSYIKSQGAHPVRLFLSRRCSAAEEFRYPPLFGSQVTKTGYEYGSDLRAGDCGAAVYYSGDTSIEQSPLVGFHIAKVADGRGSCNSVTFEAIEAARAKLGMIVDAPLPKEVEPCFGVSPFPSMLVCGVAVKPSNISTRTSLVKTPLFEAWGESPVCPASGVTFTDAVGNTVDPVYNAINPYSSELRYYDPSKVLEASHAAFRPHWDASVGSARTVYSFEEAIRGVPGRFKSLSRSTSPGFPYCCEGLANKTSFFGSDGEFVFDTPAALALRAEVDQIVVDAELGVRHLHVYSQFFKDETLTKEAVARGKLRLISACPLAWFVVMRMYFMAFQVSVIEHSVVNHTAVGLNPYSRWDQLYRKLSSRGKYTVAGDFKRYDASEQPAIHDAILERIQEWYADGPRNHRIREVLWREVTSSRQLTGLGPSRSYIVQWQKAMPSGNPLTSIINSFYNLILFNLCWNHLCFSELRNKMHQYTYICVMGDDNIQNVSDEVVSWWNQATITEAMAHFHMTYTDDHKGNSTVMRTLAECSFCQRSFRHDEENGCVGPLSLDTVLWIPYFCHKNPDVRAVMAANVELTLGELSLHGDDVWNAWAPRIFEACKKVDYMPLGPNMRRHYTATIINTTPSYCYDAYTDSPRPNPGPNVVG